MSDIVASTWSALGALGDTTRQLWDPHLRLGITGLSRAGKSVFTTALIHHLIAGDTLPAFAASAEGRIARAQLKPQAHADLPRFAYEANLAQLMAGAERRWPESTRRISELRLEIGFETRRGWFPGARQLTLDIVDYPGEWLLDLPLMDKSYGAWAHQTLSQARRSDRAASAGPFLARLADIPANASASEVEAEALAQAFKGYLAALRADPESVATVPPGRFLMPGDLEGSPVLTFAPLDLDPGHEPGAGTLAGLMAERYEAYKRLVITPFFREHFARLDRQIVLVDALSALDRGAAALADLETAMGEVLTLFNPGRNSLWSSLFAPRAERVLFAATKADHLHHGQHPKLEAVLRELVARAIGRAEGAGARVETAVLAAVRATREVQIKDGRDRLEAVAGVPEAGETVGGTVCDGVRDFAVFPGELPADTRGLFLAGAPRWQMRVPRFRPPLLAADAGGRLPALPEIGMGSVLDFLLGDRLA